MAQAKGVIVVLLKNGHTLVEHRAHRAEVVGDVVLHGVGTVAVAHNAPGRETGAFKTCIVAAANVEHRSANVGKAAIVGWVAYGMQFAAVGKVGELLLNGAAALNLLRLVYRVVYVNILYE